MKEKIIKGIYWVISIFLLLLGIDAIRQSQPYSCILSFFSLAILANPFLMGILLKKSIIDEKDYIIVLKMMLSVLGTIIAFVIAFVVFYKNYYIYADEAEENSEAILKISMFVVYLIIIHLCASDNKGINYIIFGLFYCMCVASSFFSVDITDEYINLLNTIPGGSMDMESYKLLTDDFIIPIKESILTYIIFDTVIEYKKNRKIEKKKDVVNRDYFPI